MPAMLLICLIVLPHSITLHVCAPHWPRYILINTYRAPTELFVDGEVIYSLEGTTQGDPLAMPMYAIPLVKRLQSLTGDVKQIWYASDAAATWKLSRLHEWWSHLTTLGPKFGYSVNAKKTQKCIKLPPRKTSLPTLVYKSLLRVDHT